MYRSAEEGTTDNQGEDDISSPAIVGELLNGELT